MRPYRLFALIAACALVAAQSRAEPTYESVFTDLRGYRCKLLRVQEEGANSVQSCPGVKDYRLLVVDSDSRMSVTVVDPSGRKSPLDFWTVITRTFSSVGPRAEWRIVRTGNDVASAALIVRVNVDDELDAKRVNSYLAVTEISGERSCVVARIPSAVNANKEARKAADATASLPCLKELD